MIRNSTSFLATIFVILVGLIPFSMGLIREKETSISGLFLITAILMFIVFYFIYSFIGIKIKEYTNVIKINKSEIQEIKKKLKYMENIHSLDKRINILENDREKRPKR